MRARGGRSVLAVVLVLSTIPFEEVSAGPEHKYTRPAWTNVGASRRYGCDPNGSWFSGTNAEGTSFNCLFHGGIDYYLTFDPVVSTRAGTVTQVIQTNPNNPGSACVDPNTPGNIIVISHGDGTYARYLHLTQNGSKVSTGEVISAGQLIGTSGNSGYTCGAHLHYTLSNSATSGTASHTFDPDDKWTVPATTTGRAPWLDDYTSKQASTLDICYGDTVTTWVKFKNVGGRPWPWVNDMWNRGKVVLYSTNSLGTAAATSPLQASDWETTTRITPADSASVAADGTGQFTFGVKGGGTAGQTYSLYVNLAAFGLNEDLPLDNFWFKYSEQVKISVFVIPTQACS